MIQQQKMIRQLPFYRVPLGSA